ncbi:unnamed protein product [Cuscuta epithymum]|uniref:Uncharacterized protein n=1 Tax=Cuscuta epithymum TaxID=186058 RepID=A0AAV0GDA2_9ASTE|nr:unnamed protein product [Cuscuta epithymum]
MDFGRRIYTRRQWGNFSREWNEEKKKKKLNEINNHGCREGGVDGKGVSLPVLVGSDEGEEVDGSPDGMVGVNVRDKTAASMEVESEGSIDYDELKKVKKRRRKFVTEKNDDVGEILLKSSNNMENGMGNEKIGKNNVSLGDEGGCRHEPGKERGDESCGGMLNDNKCDYADDDYALFLDKYVTCRDMLKIGGSMGNAAREKNDICFDSIEFLCKSLDLLSGNTENADKKVEGSNGNNVSLMVDEEEVDDVTWIAKKDFVLNQRNKIDKKSGNLKNKCMTRRDDGSKAAPDDSIAYRLRSCLASKFTVKENKLIKNSLPASKDGTKSEPSFDVEAKEDDKCVKKNNVCAHDRKKVKHLSKWRRSQCGRGDPQFKKILLDSIWGRNADLTKNDMHFSRENIYKLLPLKFWFGDEDPAPPEKSKSEKETEGLFLDLESGLQEVKESLTTQALREEDGGSSEEKHDDDVPQVCCQKGKHLLILDEQIGLMCKYCSFVHRERKYILPSFATKTGVRQYTKFYGGLDLLSTEDLPFSGGAGNPQCTLSIHGGGTVWDVLPLGTKEAMYPHQREGFEFLWRNIAGDIHIENLQKLQSNGGNGCIISHAPGTGKTRLTITFLLSFMKLFPSCRPIIIAPRSMLLTWEEEFRKWEVDVPFHNVNNPSLSGNENGTGFGFPNEPKGIESKRMLKLCSWAKGSGILGISYRLFEQLVRVKENEDDDERVRKILLKVPSLVVLDEGHTPRNDDSLIWNALSRLETTRRVILSGTPFQNNFDELYNTLCLVCPKYVQRRNSGKKIWDRLTSSIGKDKNIDVRELKSIIAPLVHVHKGTILLERLPGLRSNLIFLKPTTLQQNMFSLISEKKFFEEDYLMTRISVHPSLVKDVPDFSEYRNEVEDLELDPDAGVKTEFVFALIRLSDLHSEKVIVFSQFLAPMELIKKQLEYVFNWVEGREVLYMDGDIHSKNRQACMNTFNNPKSEAKVLLASTKACSEGICLVGASRVVLLDVVWNPSVKRQALSRAYRLGQTKIVHVYHLISSTMEAKKFAWQAKKDFISELVFSTSADEQVPCSSSKEDILGSEDKILEAIVQHPKHCCIFERLVHNPKELDSIDSFDFVE